MLITLKVMLRGTIWNDDFSATQHYNIVVIVSNGCNIENSNEILVP